MRLINEIENLKNKGYKQIYINAVNMEPYEIEILKKMIAAGILKPVKKEIEKMIVPEYVDQFLKGDYICPQCNYEIL